MEGDFAQDCFYHHLLQNPPYHKLELISVFAGPSVQLGALESLESQARYIARPAMAMETPPDRRWGATLLVLDPLQSILRTPAHIPDPGQHSRRSYGAYCNRARVTARAAKDKSDRATQAGVRGQDSEFARETRRTWTRLLRKISEVDPLVGSCNAELGFVSVITQPMIVGRILRHLRNERCKARDPFKSHAPPRSAALSRQ